MCRPKKPPVYVSREEYDNLRHARLARIVQNDCPFSPTFWDDAGGSWWRSLIPIAVEDKKKLGVVWNTYVCAYLAALQSGTRCKGGLGEQCAALVAQLRLPGHAGDGGRPKMSAVVDTLLDCPGEVFTDSLNLLHWAGHIGAHTTLEAFRRTMEQAIGKLLGTRERYRRIHGREVWASLQHTCHGSCFLRGSLVVTVMFPDLWLALQY